jgi:hypothetical protein
LERQYPDIEVRELTLVNGMRLAIKQTDFLADEVLVTAVAVGGLSEVRAGIVGTGGKSADQLLV